MSTIDPVEARRHRQQARIGSRAALFGIVVGLVLIAAGATFEARALFGFVEFDASGDVDQPPLAVFGMIVGLPLLLAGFFVHIGASRRFTGRLLSAPGVGPLSILFVGLAVGAWWGVLSLGSPGALWLIPATLTLLAALSLLVGARNRARRRSRHDVLRTLVTRGRIVPAVITEIPQLDPSSGGLIAGVTAKFTDAQGVDRWITKTGQWARAELPATGEVAAVLFDPEHPADTARIWIGPAGSATAADFERWHA